MRHHINIVSMGDANLNNNSSDCYHLIIDNLQLEVMPFFEHKTKRRWNGVKNTSYILVSEFKP